MLRKYYHLVIVFTGVLSYMITFGLCNNILSLYLPFIEEQDFVSASAGSLTITVRCVAAFLATFVVVKFYDRVSLRLGLCLSTLVAAAGVALTGIGGSLFIYYLGAVLMGIGFTMAGVVPSALLLKNWFRGRLGLATGISSAGSGLASMVFSPVFSKIILRRSLRAALMVQAGLMAFFALLLFLLVRDNPEQMGRAPYGESGTGGKAGRSAAARGVCEKSPSTRVFVVLAVMMTFVGGVSTTGSSHLCILNTSCGYSADTAARALSLFSFMLIVGKLTAGAMADAIGSRKAGITLMMAYFVACLLTWGMDGQALFWSVAMALVLGWGGSAFALFPPLWSAETAPPRDYARVLQWMQRFFNFGGIVMSPLPGLIADKAGEYRSSFMLLAAAMVGASLLLQWVYRVQRGRDI